MEESRVIKLKEQAKIVVVATGVAGVIVGALTGAYVYAKGRTDQFEDDVGTLAALGKAGAIKLELPEITETTTWKNIYD